MLENLTPNQVQFLRLFLRLTDGLCELNLSGDGWIKAEWIGWADKGPTHLRIQADHSDVIDVVLTLTEVALYEQS